MLENDYDPVPCPVCGNYQRFMFPRLLQSKWTWIHAVLLVLIASGCLDIVASLYCTLEYFEKPNSHNLENMLIAWSILIVIAVVGYGLTFVRNLLFSRFDPNLDDKDARLAIGRSRAITRAQFEEARRQHQQTEAKS